MFFNFICILFFKESRTDYIYAFVKKASLYTNYILFFEIYIHILIYILADTLEQFIYLYLFPHLLSYLPVYCYIKYRDENVKYIFTD